MSYLFYFCFNESQKYNIMMDEANNSV